MGLEGIQQGKDQFEEGNAYDIRSISLLYRYTEYFQGISNLISFYFFFYLSYY